jgi:hypothetical protein
MTSPAVWVFLIIGYLATVAIEAPVLIAGLSTQRSRQARIAAAFWLTACTYPVVVLTLPAIAGSSNDWVTSLLLAEVVVACGKSCSGGMMCGRQLIGGPQRDDLVILVANILSAALGQWLLTDWLADTARGWTS